MNHQEELEYIHKVRSGNATAYAALVDHYKTMAYSIALKVLGNPEDAEDVAQEGFIKAYQQLHQFEGKAKFSTWLYTIVYRTALAKTREQKMKTLSINEHFRENFTNDYSTPQLVLMDKDDEQRAIQMAINSLPETEGLLVMLYYINDNSVSEIQQITGLSMANIKIRLFRARKKLERDLKHLMQETSTTKGYGQQGR
jgi:RNA polymerase sigma-70 factor (ECF subfamily)